MKTETFTKAEAPSPDLLVMAAQARLMTKAETHVSGYTREDGTKVAGHMRETGSQSGTTPAEWAKWHAGLAAKHEDIANRLGADHANHPAHVEMSALHLAACRHAHRAGDENLDAKTRAHAVAARAALKKLLARRAEAMNAGKSGASGLMAKALAEGKRLVLFQKAKPKETGPDLSNLLADMERAQSATAFA